jgi:D-tyrosyl-tRNA(Tyr) deacylase
MIVVLQRVKRAKVTVDGRVVGRIGQGLLALVAVQRDDTEGESGWCARKVAEVRLFADSEGKMNRSVRDIGGAVLAVSQFTLVGDLAKGTRPSFSKAARPERALPLFDHFTREIRRLGLPVEKGIFQAMMDVELVNDGPVTIILKREAMRQSDAEQEGLLEG